MNPFPKSNKAVPYIFIAVLAVIAFWPTLKIGFIWDDHEMIEANPAIQSVTALNIIRAFKGDVFDGKGDAYFRPLQTLSNMADHAVWGLRPFGFHLTNLLLHIFAGCLLFVCLRRVFEDEKKSLLVTLAFAVHPIISECFINISGRTEMMAAIFTFGAMILAFQKSRASYVFSLFSFFLACLSKESGMAMPLLLMATGWYNPSLRVSVWRLIGYAVPSALYFYLRERAVGPASLFPGIVPLISFLTQDFPTIITTYLRILLFPYDIHSHRRMVFHAPWMILSPLLLAGFFALAFVKKWRWAFFAGAWFLIGMAPKIPILATNGLMLDHWAYVSAIGLFILIVFLVKAWWVPMACIVVWLGMGHWNIQQRNTDRKLYAWALRYPTSSTVRYNYGLIHYQEGDFVAAQGLFEDALRINPDFIPAINGKALCLWKIGKSTEAVNILSEAIMKYPNTVPFYVNRALIRRGKAGLADLEQALRIKPGYGFAVQLKREIEREML